MDWSRVLICVFVIGFLTSMVMSFVVAYWSLFMSYMVKTEHNTNWGLYWWCNTTEIAYTCHFIPAGDSPAYMEVARFCAALSPLMMLANPFIKMYIPPDSATARWLAKLAVAWLPSLNVVAVLSLVGTQYTYDDRWKDSSPSLDFGFWIIAGVAALDFPFTCFFFFVWIVAFIRVQRRNKERRRRCQGRQGQEQPPRRDSESTCNHACKTKVTFLREKISCVTVKVRKLWTRFSEAVIKRLKGDHSGAVKKHEVKSVYQKDDQLQGEAQPSRGDAESNRNQAEPKGIANVKARVVWMRTVLAILIHRLKSQGPGAVTKHEVTHQRKEEPEISGNGDISNHNPVADPAADVVSSEVFSTTNHQLSRVDIHCLPDSMTGRFVFQLRHPEHLCSESSI